MHLVDKFLFVTGTPRSGTTYLMNILNDLEELTITPEVNFPKLLGRLEGLFYREKNFKKKALDQRLEC